MDKIKLRILRGIHSIDSIESLGKELIDADIILIENLIPKSHVQPTRSMLYALSNNQQYIDSFSKDLDKNLHNNFVARVAWELRGKGKLFDLIDLKFNDETAEKDLEQVSINYGFGKAFDEIQDDPSSRYTVIDKFLKSRLSVLRYRDKVMANQIDKIIRNPEQPYISAVVAKNGVCNIAVVQGLMHRVKPLLETLHPSLEIEERIYNPRGAQQSLTNPVIAIFYDLIMSGRDTLTDKEVDYFLYNLLLYGKSVESAPSQSTHSLTLELMDTGLKHKLFSDLARTNSDIGSIDHFTDKQLSDIVDNLLKEK